MKKIFIAISYLSTISLFGQTGINTKSPNAALEVISKSSETSYSDGIIPPKLTKADLVNKLQTAYSTNQTGAVIYVTDTTGTFNDTRVEKIFFPGYYHFNGSQWIPFQTPWIPLTTFNGNRSGIYLYSLGDGKERGLREKINFLDNGRIGFGTNTPSTRLHLSNMRESTETLTNAIISERSIFTIESFGGASMTSLKSAPLIKMIQSRGIGTGGNVLRPDNGDSMGGLEYVAANGNSTGNAALTAAKIDVKFKLDTSNGQKNTADIFFTASDYIDNAHTLTTRMSILGDGKVGINSSSPTTNLFVQGSYATSTNNDTVSSTSEISVKGKSTIFVSVNSGSQSIRLIEGVVGQRIVIVNTSGINILNITNGAKTIIITANEGKELVYNGTTWYALS